MNKENKKMEIEYILSQKEKGIDDERIKKALLKAGWKDEFISIGFTEAEKLIQKKDSEDLKDDVIEKEDTEIESEEKEKSVAEDESQKDKEEDEEHVVKAESLRSEKEESYQKQNNFKAVEKEKTSDEISQEQILQKKPFDIQEKKKILNKTEQDEKIILILVLVVIGFLLLGVSVIFVDFLLGV